MHALPPDRPQAVVLIDVGQHTIETFLGADLEGARRRIEGYDVIAAVDVRGLQRRLGTDPEGRRLAELGPPQKTKQLNRRGRTLEITLDLLVRGTCNVARPFSDPRSLARYFCNGQTTRFRRRLEEVQAPDSLRGSEAARRGEVPPAPGESLGIATSGILRSPDDSRGSYASGRPPANAPSYNTARRFES